MRYAVVDTNVLVVANGDANHADDRCRLAAAEALGGIQRAESLVLDRGWEILGEYARNVDKRREPGPGTLFFIWASGTGSVCWVRLTPHPDRGYVEFPDMPELASFDPDDRKFITATIKASTDWTELLNAVDRDYREHARALREAGVVVRELCPHILK